jgi:hypothetical protein
MEPENQTLSTLVVKYAKNPDSLLAYLTCTSLYFWVKGGAQMELLHIFQRYIFLLINYAFLISTGK